MTGGGSGGGGGGGGSFEQLPIVFTVPKFLPNKLQSVCGDDLVPNRYNLLGFGDVGVPALLVVLALKFDLHLWPGKWTKVYYPISGIGMRGGGRRDGREEGGGEMKGREGKEGRESAEEEQGSGKDRQQRGWNCACMCFVSLTNLV